MSLFKLTLKKRNNRYIYIHFEKITDAISVGTLNILRHFKCVKTISNLMQIFMETRAFNVHTLSVNCLVKPCNEQYPQQQSIVYLSN